ncbi:MAG: beta-lactamase family protein [Polyangiaceae bacterium]|nr:beta-lactamase family protein [Polyangiaceae bacterium]
MRLAALLVATGLLAGCERPGGPVPSSAATSAGLTPAASAPHPAAEPATAPDAATPGTTASPRAVDTERLARLVSDAKALGSDALVVSQRGTVLASEWWSAERGPIQTMSVTKSVLALVVGCAIEQGLLGLRDPVARFFPIWEGSDKASITVEHLLTHTSGLDEGKNTAQIYAARSFVDQALASPLVSPAGKEFLYGNRASNLLSGVLAKAAGKPTDRYADECLFRPLGITRWSWSRDRAGNAHGLAGLHLLPEDLHKLGTLVLHDGRYDGKRVLDAAWVRKVSAEPALSPPHKPASHLWWLLPAWTKRTVDEQLTASWRAAGVDGAFVARAAGVMGSYDTAIGLTEAWQRALGDPTLKALDDELYSRKLRDARYEHGPTVGSYAHGSLGQFLVIVPAQGVVAVRMRRSPKSTVERKDIARAFPDFPQRVASLIAE